jgi:hypothetical protein
MEGCVNETMCRNMDINFYHKQHEQIKTKFRHDIIMRKLKEREDKLFKAMFIKILFIIIIFVLIIALVTSVK